MAKMGVVHPDLLFEFRGAMLQDKKRAAQFHDGVVRRAKEKRLTEKNPRNLVILDKRVKKHAEKARKLWHSYHVHYRRLWKKDPDKIIALGLEDPEVDLTVVDEKPIVELAHFEWDMYPDLD